MNSTTKNSTVDRQECVELRVFVPSWLNCAVSTAQLRRSLGLLHSTALVVGIIVGSAIFAQPSEITRLLPATRMAMLAWLAAGVLTFCGALVCAELAIAFPETGGVYVFLKRLFSPALGFLWGWAMFWSMHSGIIAAIAVVMARYVGYFVPLGPSGTRAVAIAAIVLLSAINYFGVRPGGVVQVALTTIKVAAIIALVVLLFALGGRAHSAVLTREAAPAASLSSFALAVAAGLFAFGGWHMVTYAAGETRTPERTLPRALVLGTLIVTACYMLLNAAYQYVLPASEVARSALVAAAAAERVLGARAAGAIAVVVIISALGSMNGIILAGPRVYFAMVQDGLAFRSAAAIHPKYRTPYIAIAAQAVVASALVATNSYRQLFTRVVYTEWIFFALLAIGLVKHGKGQMANGKLAVAIVFSVAAFGIAINQAAADWRGSAWGFGLVLLGLPVYRLLRKSNRQPAKARSQKS